MHWNIWSLRGLKLWWGIYCTLVMWTKKPFTETHSNLFIVVVLHTSHAMSCCCCWLYHVHHVVHYTNINTCHVLLLLLTVSCTRCCPLHKYQHMPCLVALADCIMYTMLSTTQISTHAMSCCSCWLYHVHHVVHYININTCHVLLLLLTVSCTPCCPLHKYQHMQCLVALADCIMYTMLSTTQISTHAMSCCSCWLYHVHHVVHYININTCHVLLLLLTVSCTPCCPLHKYQHMPCLVALADCIMYTMLSTTQISTHAMSCSSCWLYPCTLCYKEAIQTLEEV